MSDQLSSHLLIYRLAALGSGVVAIVLGFLLFSRGVYGPVAAVQAQHGGSTMTLQNAAPGALFALFGASVIAVSVFRGYGVKASASQRNATRVEGGLTIDAETEWQNVMNSIMLLERKGQISSTELTLLQHNMAALATAIEQLRRLSSDSESKSDFEGFASAPGG